MGFQPVCVFLFAWVQVKVHWPQLCIFDEFLIILVNHHRELPFDTALATAGHAKYAGN
jgi:hypothetical protein